MGDLFRRKRVVTEVERTSWRTTWLPAIFGVVGSVLGASVAGGITWGVNYQTLEAQRDAQRAEATREASAMAREQRRPIYVEFEDAANEWATRQAAASECPNLQECRYSQSDLDDSRYRFQGAVNAMYIYGSAEAVSAAVAVAGTLPASLIGVTGSAEVGEVDREGFRAAIVEFYDQMCIDLSYAPKDCVLAD